MVHKWDRKAHRRSVPWTTSWKWAAAWSAITPPWSNPKMRLARHCCADYCQRPRRTNSAILLRCCKKLNKLRLSNLGPWNFLTSCIETAGRKPCQVFGVRRWWTNEAFSNWVRGAQCASVVSKHVVVLGLKRSTHFQMVLLISKWLGMSWLTTANGRPLWSARIPIFSTRLELVTSSKMLSPSLHGVSKSRSEDMWKLLCQIFLQQKLNIVPAKRWNLSRGCESSRCCVICRIWNVRLLKFPNATFLQRIGQPEWKR